jgi:hypothetical protein
MESIHCFMPFKRQPDHLASLAMLPNPLNARLQKGFTVSQTSEKHGWPESLVWAVKLDGKDDLGKCHELQWGMKAD